MNGAAIREDLEREGWTVFQPPPKKRTRAKKPAYYVNYSNDCGR